MDFLVKTKVDRRTNLAIAKKRPEDWSVYIGRGILYKRYSKVVSKGSLSWQYNQTLQGMVANRQQGDWESLSQEKISLLLEERLLLEEMREGLMSKALLLPLFVLFVYCSQYVF